MSPLTFLELEAALLLAGLLTELAIAALVLRHDRRKRQQFDLLCSEPPADWEPPSAALVISDAQKNRVPR